MVQNEQDPPGRVKCFVAGLYWKRPAWALALSFWMTLGLAVAQLAGSPVGWGAKMTSASSSVPFGRSPYLSRMSRSSNAVTGSFTLGLPAEKCPLSSHEGVRGTLAKHQKQCRQALE